MCGFLFEIATKENTLPNQEMFTTLLELSKQRGPDDTKILKENNYRFGFNRLAILDVTENGSQPMKSPSQRYVLVCNGEIYNYSELRKAYKLTNLKSTSDTEVVLHLIDKIGVPQTIKQLNGMFAIVVMDTVDKKVYFARDPAGIKPFYYGHSEKGWVAASQFNQIFKHTWFKHKLIPKPEVVKSYFGLGYMPAPETIYKHIYQLEPGELLTLQGDGKVHKQLVKKWEANNNNFDTPESNKDEQLQEAIALGVQRQLVSDVPLACFLSGGIDSPLITAHAKKHQSKIQAFTVQVEGELNESEEAKKYAKALGCNHIISKFTTKALLCELNNHFNGLPEPFGDYSSLPTYLITKRAKQTHTVMLSGDGGDELFFGYPRMLDIMKKRYWFKMPFLFRKPLIRILNKIKVIHTWAPYFHENLSDWILSKQLYISDDKLNAMFPNMPFSKSVDKLYNVPKTISNSRKLLPWLRYNEFYGHMQRVLKKVDLTSMANSLEVRVPFLDLNTIDRAWAYQPKSFKTNNDLKAPLKKALAKQYPESIITKHKKGFSVPIETWLRNELKEDVVEVTMHKQIYAKEAMNTDAIKAYISDFYKQKHNQYWGIWHIYAWQKWAIKEELI